jgi:hypothetical protein
MEFLTRLLDARRLKGRRWFLNAIEASYSGFVNKGGKKEEKKSEKKAKSKK